MAVVYPDPAPAPEPAGIGGQLTSFFSQHIVLAGALLIALALAVGYAINKIRGGSSSSTSTTSSQQPQTLYVPTQNTFENVYTTTDSGNTTTTNNPPAPSGPSGAGPSGTATVTLPGGDPLRPNAGPNGQLAIIPFGTQLTLGPASAGDLNRPGGSTTWYATDFNGQPGWVSAEGLNITGASNGPGQGLLPIGPGGVNPGTGSGDPFSDGHPVALRTIFSMNHGVSHHLNTVLGA